MSEQTSVVEQQSILAAKSPHQRERYRRSRWLQIGCLPVTVILTTCLLMFVNLVIVSRAPTWVSDPEEYLLAQRIVGSIGALAGLQVIGTWMLGVVAAAAAAGAAAGQGGLLSQRLAIVHRRVAPAAWAVLVLRVSILLALAVGAGLIYPYLVDDRGSWTDLSTIHRWNVTEIITAVFAILTALLHWLSGPFLRLRYSLTLGAWGASWAQIRSRRAWMALTARMGAGMCGSLASLWVYVLGVMGALTIRQPFSHSYALDVRRAFFAFLPTDTWEIIVLLLGFSALLVVYMIGQLTLPPFYLWLTRRRLASRAAVTERKWRGDPSLGVQETVATALEQPSK